MGNSVIILSKLVLAGTLLVLWIRALFVVLTKGSRSPDAPDARGRDALISAMVADVFLLISAVTFEVWGQTDKGIVAGGTYTIAFCVIAIFSLFSAARSGAAGERRRKALVALSIVAGPAVLVALLAGLDLLDETIILVLPVFASGIGLFASILVLRIGSPDPTDPRVTGHRAVSLSIAALVAFMAASVLTFAGAAGAAGLCFICYLGLALVSLVFAILSAVLHEYRGPALRALMISFAPVMALAWGGLLMLALYLMYFW